MTKTNRLPAIDSQMLIRGLTAGLVLGIIEITINISLATLVFSGALAPFFARGVGLFLMGGVIMGLVIAAVGTLPGSAIGPQDGPAALIAVGASAVGAGMLGNQNPEATYVTVVAAIVISSIITGLAFYLIGQFKLGNLVRFIPFPVIGGFLAGTGWLIVRGALELMLGQSLSLSALASLFQSDVLLRWLPGVLFAASTLFLLRRFNHFLLWPALVFSGIALFYVLIFALGLSMDEARASGILMQPLPSGGLWQPLSSANFGLVDWNMLAANAGKFIAIPIVSLIGFLLNASALELVAKRDMDLNRELRVAGLANLLAGLASAPAGYHLLGATSLAQRMGARTRITSFVVPILCALMLLAGGTFVSFLPAAFLSGMLLVLGLSFLMDWLYDARKQLPASDYILVWVILFVVATFGFLEGVAVGIALAVVLFVFKYARIATVRDSLNGKIYRSKVERPPFQRDVLHRKGEQVHIFRLQGYLFFGTSNGILDRVREILEDKTFNEHFIVLDFQRVHNLDSSAVSSFVRMRQLADLYDIYLVLTQVRPEIRRQMEQGGFVGDQRVQFFPALDFGMEWCENMLLMRNEASTEFIATSIQAQLKRTFPHPELVKPFFEYLERVEAPINTILMSRGDPSDSMYFIETGRIDIQLTTDDGDTIRLRSLRGGTVVGEIAMYMKTNRTADVITTQNCVLYRLTSEALERIEAESPEIASALHEWVATQMAERLAENNNTIEALLD